MGLKPPSQLLIKLSQKLFQATATQDAFVQSLMDPQAYPSCILWLKPRPDAMPFAVEPPLFWQPEFVDRLAVGSTPGAHPLHEAGHYYCLDFSSVFAASVLMALPTHPRVAIDVCAAPGGKSIFMWRSHQPHQLICNETIGKRVGMLIGNLKRCGVNPAIALSTDPSHLALRLSQTADLVVVDAPCSGQSLLAKGGKAEGCFHPRMIKQNAQRQKRILANAAQLVAPGGHLIYTTCTFAPEENEQVGQWLLRKFPPFEARPVEHLTAYQSHLTDLPCYRMWPQTKLGAGAFAMVLHNTATGKALPLPTEQWPGWRWSAEREFL
jgi:16S rRNA C967 or C1407 C5-methylase (RsmB/RsmF family)